MSDNNWAFKNSNNENAASNQEQPFGAVWD